MLAYALEKRKIYKASRRTAVRKNEKGQPFAAVLFPDIGGVEGDRTPDLCNAIAALSQLSYDPVFSHASDAERISNLTKIAGCVKEAHCRDVRVTCLRVKAAFSGRVNTNFSADSVNHA